MPTVVLYRESEMPPEELTALRSLEDETFKVTHSRQDIMKGDLVIPRYSCLPFFREQEQEVVAKGAAFLNSFRQHRFVADLGAWYPELEELTPQTWFNLDEIPQEGPFFLKGATNSKKFCWDTHAYAADRRAAIKVAMNLMDDSLIGTQSIVVRKFIPLHTYMIGPRGLPITKEFRFFVLDGVVLTGGFYWSSHVEDLRESGFAVPAAAAVPQSLLDAVVAKVSPHIRFWVMDVAQTAGGDWILVELNDACMSGLSENDPLKLWSGVKRTLGPEPSAESLEEVPELDFTKLSRVK